MFGISAHQANSLSSLKGGIFQSPREEFHTFGQAICLHVRSKQISRVVVCHRHTHKEQQQQQHAVEGGKCDKVKHPLAFLSLSDSYRGQGFQSQMTGPKAHANDEAGENEDGMAPG